MVGMGGADLCEFLRPHLISRHRYRYVHRVQMQRRLCDERLQVTKLRGCQMGKSLPAWPNMEMQMAGWKSDRSGR